MMSEDAACPYAYMQGRAEQARCPECKVSLNGADHWSFCRYLAKQAQAMQRARRTAAELQAYCPTVAQAQVQHEPWGQAAKLCANVLPPIPVAEQIRAAVEAEREACAKLAVECLGVFGKFYDLPDRIRARGDK